MADGLGEVGHPAALNFGRVDGGGRGGGLRRGAGQPQRYSREPLASWWQHAAAGLLGVLVPEDLL